MGKVEELKGKRPLFQVLFLKESDERGAEVKEVNEVDFREVKKHLEQGEAIFIVPKHVRNLKTSYLSFLGICIRDSGKKQAAEPWYFTHE